MPDVKKTIFLIGIVFIFLFFGFQVFAGECLETVDLNNPKINPSSCYVSLDCSDNPPGACGTDNSCCAGIYYCIDQANSCTNFTKYTCPAGSDICSVNVTVSQQGTNYVRYYSVDKADNREETRYKIVVIEGGCLIGGQSYGAGVCNPTNKCQMCDPAQNQTSWSNVPSGYVCAVGSGQVAVSSTNYCNYGENCDLGDCSAQKWWTSCNGAGACRSAGSSPPIDSYTENIYAQEGYTLTNTCGITGTAYCATNQCRDSGTWHHICSKRCDTVHACNYWIDASCVDHCTNGIQDCNETGIDSGGSCAALCTRQNPGVSLSPSSQTGNPGDTLSYTVDITNNDPSQCGDSTFNLTKSCPSGWTCTLSSTSKTIGPGASVSVNLSVTSPSNTSAGNYTVSVTATNGGATSYSGTDSAIYTVSIIELDFSVSINPVSGSVAQGSSVSINVTATLISGTTETVYFSASGLHSTMSYSFSTSNNCLPNPNCSRTMTVNTSASTPTGTYNITVCGTNSSGTLTRCYVYYSLTVTAASPVVVPPSVTTNPATNITQTSATLNGTLNSMGNVPSCLVWFEWGTTPSYGNSTPVQTLYSTGAFSANISGLNSNITYYFKAFAKNGGSW